MEGRTKSLCHSKPIKENENSEVPLCVIYILASYSYDTIASHRTMTFFSGCRNSDHVSWHIHRLWSEGNLLYFWCPRVHIKLTVPRSMMKQSPWLKLCQLRGTSVALTTLRPFTCRSLWAVRSLVRTWFSPDATPPAWSGGGGRKKNQTDEASNWTQSCLKPQVLVPTQPTTPRENSHLGACEKLNRKERIP